MRIGAVLISLFLTQLGQQAADRPQFEVASIKPSVDPPGSVVGIFESPGHISARNVTLKRCVRGAYGVPEPQIIGGPKWVQQDRFQIEAKAIGPAGDRELMVMLQTLLADRFKLLFHREQRALQGYRLVTDKNPKMSRSDPGGSSVGQSERGRLAARSYSMAQLALKLAEALQQPVVDATGLDGMFDFQLEWAPDDLQAKSLSAASDADRPSIFVALREQLGLKLEAGRIQAEVIVIDSAVKPSVD